MALEIERKFLVNDSSFIHESFKSSIIKQGFLNSDKYRTVRVRIKDSKGFITVKGISNHSGTSRKEWEYEISKSGAEELLVICEPTLIEKERYYIQLENLTIEVDVFEKLNSGLILAEIELSSESEAFKKPVWLGKEVTGDIRYYNSYLSKHPFQFW